MSTTTDKFAQPAFVGGLAMGVLSSLPVIATGNCCCLWILGGGVIAVWVLQQNQREPVTQRDGAMAGFLAGLAGSLVYLILSIPLTILLGPMQAEMLRRLADQGQMTPEVRNIMLRYVGGPIGVLVNFFAMLVVGMIFSTIGGLIGVLVFAKKPPPVEPLAAEPPAAEAPPADA